MTDKVKKIREEIKIVVERRLNLLNGDYFDLDEEADGFTNEIMDIIDSLQEEPVSEDLDKEMDNYLASVFNEKMDGGEPRFTTWFKALQKTAIHFANWQKEQIMKKEL